MAQDLARLRAFVQVFEAGGFSAAARAHGRSKALLSKYITDLEDDLGVRLMNRTTRTLSLTEAGEAYYREVSQILQHLDDLDASIASTTVAARGLLRVSAPRNFGEIDPGAGAVRLSCATIPDVSLDLRLEDRFVDLVDEGIDVALRISDLPDSSLIARRIAEMRHHRLRRAGGGRGAWRARPSRCLARPALCRRHQLCRTRPTGVSSSPSRRSRCMSPGGCGSIRRRRRPKRRRPVSALRCCRPISPTR